jgi:hypothetical protein
VHGTTYVGAVSPRKFDQLHDEATGGRQPTNAAFSIYDTRSATMEKRTDLQRVAIDAPVILDSVPCNICQHEVPASEALVAEATDYVVYFCGLDCYERWRNQRRAETI